VFPLGEKGIGTAPYLIHCPQQTVVNGEGFFSCPPILSFKIFLLIRPAFLKSNFSVEKEGGGALGLYDCKFQLNARIICMLCAK